MTKEESNVPFPPPKLVGDEPPLGFHNANGFLSLVLEWHPE